MTGARLFLLGALLAGAALGQERPPPPARSAPAEAPMLPAEFRGLPRLAVSESPGTPGEGPPLTVRLHAGGSEACYQPRFSGDRPEAVSLPLPGSERRVLSLVQLAYDRTRQERYLFFDGGEESMRATLVLGANGRSPRLSAPLGSWEIEAVSAEDTACAKLVGQAPIGHHREWHEGDGPNAGAVLVRVEVREEAKRPVWGWCLAEGLGGASTSGAIRNPDAPSRQEWNLYSYVPADGRSVALVLAMSKDWMDPRDRRVYRFFQFESSAFVPLTREGLTAFRLSSGPANPRPVEVTVFSEEEWVGCAARAASRN